MPLQPPRTRLDEYDSVPLIQSAALELTNHCQLRCGMCWSQSPKLYPARPKGFMDYSLFEKMINQLAEFAHHGKVTLSLSYMGESLLHPRFSDFLRLAYEHKRNGAQFKLNLYTNGLLLDKYAEQLIDSRVSVCVSIHNPVQPGLAERIQYYTAKRFELLPVYGHIVAPIVGAIVFEEHGAAARKVYGEYAPLLDSVNGYNMYSEDLQRFDDKPLTPCREPFYYLAVLWDGETLPCCHLLSPGKCSMGNVEPRLLDVWMNERYQRLREGDVSGLPCEHCGIHRGILRVG